MKVHARSNRHTHSADMMVLINYVSVETVSTFCCQTKQSTCKANDPLAKQTIHLRLLCVTRAFKSQ